MVENSKYESGSEFTHYVREMSEYEQRFFSIVEFCLNKVNVTFESKERGSGKVYRISKEEANKLEFMHNALAVIYDHSPIRYFAFRPDYNDNNWLREDRLKAWQEKQASGTLEGKVENN
jgi:hypothetical protein